MKKAFRIAGKITRVTLMILGVLYLVSVFQVVYHNYKIQAIEIAHAKCLVEEVRKARSEEAMIASAEYKCALPEGFKCLEEVRKARSEEAMIASAEYKCMITYDEYKYIAEHTQCH